jgi:hypothetical protein
LKRSQVNEWAACVSPEMKEMSVLKGFSAWKAAFSEALWRAEERPAGWLACGTLKEDGPVTWETPGTVRLEDPGNGEPVTHSDAPSAASGPAAGPVAVTPPGTEATLVQQVRHDRGQTEGVPTRQGSRRAAYERRRWGTGDGTRTQPSKGGPC